VKKIIDSLAPRMVGFDVVEVSPPLDNGITAILAGRLVANVVAATHASTVSWSP
jgi:arginase family enzyme